MLNYLLKGWSSERESEEEKKKKSFPQVKWSLFNTQPSIFSARVHILYTGG
jgi:hypothetical protein